MRICTENMDINHKWNDCQDYGKEREREPRDLQHQKIEKMKWSFLTKPAEKMKAKAIRNHCGQMTPMKVLKLI